MLLCFLLLFFVSTVSSQAKFAVSGGRFQKNSDHSISFDWPGVRVSTIVSCPISVSSATLTLNVSSSLASGSSGSHTFLINDATGGRGRAQEFLFKAANVPTLIEVALNVSAKNTLVEMIKLTEALFGVFTVFGVEISNGCSFSSPPSLGGSNAGLGIAFIGDSLTCGYGSLGVSPCRFSFVLFFFFSFILFLFLISSSFSSATEDVTSGYAGGLVESEASTIGSHFSFVCWSGKGVVRNYNSEPGPTMSQLWNLTLANDVNSAWNFSDSDYIQKVVVLLGANDLSTPPRPSFETFSSGFNALLTQIEIAYPKADLIVSCGPVDDFCYQDYQVGVK